MNWVYDPPSCSEGSVTPKWGRSDHRAHLGKGPASRRGEIGRYLSFGPVFPPGNVILQVFHLEIMWKLQQLLFLGTRRTESRVKKTWGTVLLWEALCRAGDWGGRASQEVFQRDEVWEDEH